jgi:hypothetical protein
MTDDEGREEREEREMAARAERVKRDEVLQWCRERNAAREEAERAAAKHRAPPQRPRAAAAHNADGSATGQLWERYIQDRINAASQSSMRAMTRAIGQTLGADIVALERKFEEQRKTNDELRATIAELERRLEVLEQRTPVPRPRAVGE